MTVCNVGQQSALIREVIGCYIGQQW